MNMLEHLRSRYFDPSKYSGVTVADDCMTMLLWNMSGKPVGYQVYNPLQPKKEVGDPKGQKYYSWVTKPAASKNAELAMWGLETLEWNTPLFFLTEGVFDAARLHWHGLPAVAMLSNNPVHLRTWLNAMPGKKVAAVQGDKAGRALAKYGDFALYLPETHDVADLSDEQFLEFFGKFM